MDLKHALKRVANFPKRFSVAVLLVALVAAGALVLESSVLSASEHTGPKHVRLVWHEDTATSMIFSWSTEGEGQGHRVYLDTQSHDGDVSAYADSFEVGGNSGYGYSNAYVDTNGSVYFHHIQVTGLEPSTRYYFVIESNGEQSRELYFETGPADDRPFKLLYGGDSRSDWDTRVGMNDRIEQLVQANPDILALVHGGDYISDGEDWDDWDAWLEHHQETVTADGRMLPIVPARGNHEGNGVLYNQVFYWPGYVDEETAWERNYFTTSFGQHARFINLDSEGTMTGNQLDWLETQLQDAQANRWILANYHRPAFPAVKAAGSARDYWVPLFEQYNVDLVCESDGHVLKRTKPIRDEQVDSTGIVYVGEGGLGVDQRVPDTDRWYLEKAMSTHHVQLLSFSPTQLEYEAIALDGQVVDDATFDPRREPVVEEEPEEPDTGTDTDTGSDADAGSEPDAGDENADTGSPDTGTKDDSSGEPDASSGDIRPAQDGPTNVTAEGGCTQSGGGAPVPVGFLLCAVAGVLWVRRGSDWR